ncbi:beta-phosphoglucomutase family hydrolase [Cutibacterium sp. WCA-380-WT-3A]|uniref:Beta-phosphoglucomutase n=1 Tax=Cutibacterium porci TaxID=2605781 RepID=A0A7K0J6F6_9ACTN|nr:beta-phosphoglucomutase family hydrolase [Cutibacterium porci]MSS45546.1 beta-phosphoglucomutase family hydrolase [Cutibacterium porci]
MVVMDSTPLEEKFHAVLFDLDGVLTPTALIHMRAWQEMFNEELSRHQDQSPYTDDDYFAYVDGKPRYDGVRDFLASRGITLAEGTPSDSPDTHTICGLGNRKNDLFTAVLARDGIQPYPGSRRWVHVLHEHGVAMAVVSSSRNAAAVLEAAGLAADFPVLVDGNRSKAEGLPGKPAPDTYLRGAELLGVPAEQCIVVEDAVSGVRAGAAGGFGMVLGVNRGVGGDRLREAGADRVVNDLDEMAEEMA